MVNATRVEYEKVVAKLVSEGKRRAFTVPYVVRALDPFEWDQRVSAPREEQEKRKKKLGLQVKDTVPYGSYPCNLKVEGVGWCQVTIMKESADLRYRYFDMQVSLSVEVKSLRRDGKVLRLHTAGPPAGDAVTTHGKRVRNPAVKKSSPVSTPHFRPACMTRV